MKRRDGQRHLRLLIMTLNKNVTLVAAGNLKLFEGNKYAR